MNRLCFSGTIFLLFFIISCNNNNDRTIIRYYSGKIGEYPVNMTLTFNEATVGGEYRYDKNSKNLSIKGFIGPNKEISLIEIYDNDTTGYFKGRISKHHCIAGTWTSGIKKLTFRLEETNNSYIPELAYTGRYYHDKLKDASFDFLFTGNDSLKFQGSSFLIGDKEGQVHFAEIGGMMKISAGEAVHEDEMGNRLSFYFSNNSVDIKETGSFGGLNVSFEGTYMKSDTAVQDWQTYNQVVLGKDLSDGYPQEIEVKEVDDPPILTEFIGKNFSFKLENIPGGLQVSSELYAEDGRQKEIVTIGMEGDKYGEIIIVPYTSETSFETIETGEYIDHVQFDWAPADVDAWGTPKEDLVRLIFQSEVHDMVVRAKMVRSHKDWLVENFYFSDSSSIFKGKAYGYKINNIPEGLQVSSLVLDSEGLITENIVIGFEGQQYGEITIEPWRQKYALLIKDDIYFIDGKPYEVYPLVEGKWGLPKDDLKKIWFESKEDSMIIKAYLYSVYLDWFVENFKFLNE